MRYVMAILGTMHKAQEFVVYPRSNPEADVIIQSDNRICSFNPKTGRGKLSKRVNNPGFIHLAFGATEITVPQDIIDAAIAAMPQKGDRIANCVIIG